MIKSGSLFTQVLSFVNRNDFARLVSKYQAEKYSKGFRCWDQFVSMMFCQLAGADSLREICGGLSTALGKLAHLGLRQAPSRSTLSYANNNRPWQLYEGIFYLLMDEANLLAAKQKRRFRFKNPLFSIDSSTIDLCLDLCDWAEFRKRKGAVKLHLMLNHHGCLPNWAEITTGKVHDVNMAKKLDFEPGTIVVMDRGYIDYDLFDYWTGEGVWFVTRTKRNMKYRVISTRKVPARGNVISDEVIEFTGYDASRKCPHHLRRITVWDEKKNDELVFLTNNKDFAASTISLIYKDRWQIETFFKIVKQNLKIKTFVGTGENAIKTQIWTALICILILKIMQMRSSFTWSMSNLAAMLRINLLTYRDLWIWLDKPYETAALGPPTNQPLLFEL